ncbi:MAG: flagellar hook-associated protein FlgL [Lachnospiraceae bacterium]|nr:flagellar hook-associated protein FlgL [Lachnospiraceae bacterium]
MRITTQMMTTNLLNNISRNKKNMNELANQYATEQKIQKPSDDPVVAVRALKYSSQITELSQYLEKNIEDAFGWMNITESAMKSVNSVLELMDTYCTEAANDTYENDDRNAIIATLKQYRDQILDLGNTDYAGRYVFTGFRTDTPLLFDEKSTDITYSVYENLKFSDIKKTSYVKGGPVYVAGTTADEYAAQAPTLENCKKLTLAYHDLDETVPDINGEPVSSLKALNITLEDGTILTIPSAEADALGYQLVTTSIKERDCYTATTSDNPDGTFIKQIKFIPETGEVIFCDDIYREIQDCTNIEAVYNKTKFEKGDVRPEHYFQCDTLNNENGKVINYSAPSQQDIQYEINFSQKLTVNTMACNSISTNIASKIEEIINAINTCYDVEDRIAAVDKQIEDTSDADEKANLQELRNQLETEQVLKKKVMQEAFASGITTVQESQNEMNVAIANHGSRYNRLQLTESRLKNQKVDFNEMYTSNFYVNIEDVAIEYKTAETVYNASLYCSSAIVQKSLLEFL